MSCCGCACLFCARSCELAPQYFTRGELPDGAEVCFTCDECRVYTGDPGMSIRRRAECPDQIVARKRIEAEAAERRSRFRLIISN